MEVNQQVWLRRESSHWGWVPAVIVRKEEETLDNNNNNNNNNNQADNESSVFIHLVNDHSLSLTDDERHYFEDEKEFKVVIKVDKEQLKSAAHDDIKLRNINSLDSIGGGSGSSPTKDHKKNGNDESSSSIAVVVGGVDDLIGLTHLHEPAILHALRLRYDSDIIYTSTGPILIAVNPFKPMPKLYQRNAMDLYRIQGENSMKAKSDQISQTPMKATRYNTTPRQGVRHNAAKTAEKETRLSPHVYQTADDAYRQMLRGLETQKMMKNGNPKKTPRRGESRIEDTSNPVDQSILVSGESGAGKTVTTKIVLDYFAMLSKKCTTSGAAVDNNNNNTTTTTTPRKSWGGSVTNASPRKSWGVNSNSTNSNQSQFLSLKRTLVVVGQLPMTKIDKKYDNSVPSPQDGSAVLFLINKFQWRHQLIYHVDQRQYQYIYQIVTNYHFVSYVHFQRLLIWDWIVRLVVQLRHPSLDLNYLNLHPNFYVDLLHYLHYHPNFYVEWDL